VRRSFVKSFAEVVAWAAILAVLVAIAEHMQDHCKLRFNR